MGEWVKQRRNMNADDKKQDEKPKWRNGETTKKPIRHFRDLDVYQNALETGLRVYELSKKFPDDERYALTDQIRRFALRLRKHCGGVAEAALYCGFHFQAERFRRRGRRNASAHRVCISS